MSLTDDPVVFNPFADGFFDDPHPHYAEVREADPVHWSPIGQWILFRRADIVPFLRDQGTSVSDDNVVSSTEAMEMRAETRAAGGEAERSLLFVDPPDHTRLRSLMSKAFTPRTVESMRPRVERLVADLLDEVAADGEADLMERVAFPVPVTIISEMLGLPVEDAPMLRAWSHAAAKTLDPILTPDDVAAAADGFARLSEYLDRHARAKRRSPDDDLISMLIAAEDEGHRLSHDELVSNLGLLYTAGHETTVNLIGNGTLALLGHRDQYERLVADPSLAATATDELLRFDSPVQFTRRITLEPSVIGGREIEAGQFVLCCLGSANRDPQHWGDSADALDVGRTGAGAHVSFGSGAHFCLGAALARLEGQVVFAELARRFPDLELAGSPQRNRRIVLRGLDSLPLRFR